MTLRKMAQYSISDSNILSIILTQLLKYFSLVSFSFFVKFSFNFTWCWKKIYMLVLNLPKILQSINVTSLQCFSKTELQFRSCYIKSLFFLLSMGETKISAANTPNDYVCFSTWWRLWRLEVSTAFLSNSYLCEVTPP